jgi:hypothetical protein
VAVVWEASSVGRGDPFSALRRPNRPCHLSTSGGPEFVARGPRLFPYCPPQRDKLRARTATRGDLPQCYTRLRIEVNRSETQDWHVGVHDAGTRPPDFSSSQFSKPS